MNRMRSRVFRYTTTALLAVLLVAPYVTHAQIPFFGPVIFPEIQRCAAGWGAVLIVINNVIKLLLTIAIIFVAPLTIAYAGFLFVVNPTSAGDIEKAKKILTNTVVGITIALASWLIVDAVMAVFYKQDGETLTQAWWQLVSSGGAEKCLEIAAVQKPSDRTGVSTTTYEYPTGTCTAPSVGPCTVESLQSGCFGSNAPAAAQICSKESGGNVNNLSRSDITSDGHPYSGGLFQINITNSFNQQVNGKNCSEAFSGPCQNSGGYNNVSDTGRCSVTVVDKPLYDACIAAVTDGDTNITVACGLFDGDWGRWRNSANSCGLPIN